MARLETNRAILLSAAEPSYIGAAVTVDSLLDTIEVRIQRPTTAQPLAWTASGTMRVTLVVALDGVEYRSVGQVSGGIKMRNGAEQSEYRLTYHPPSGFFGMRSGNPRRLGETGTTLRAHVLLERLRGTIDTTLITLATTDSPAPAIPFRSSVAFDTATDAKENLGDGVLSLTHTAGGSNRAAFIGEANSDDEEAEPTTLTYGGATVVELWDGVVSTNFRHAGAYAIAPPASAQTVTSTLAENGASIPSEHFLGVISMTGVHQTTPVGTHNTATGTTQDNHDVTVASVGSDDMVVDNYYMYAPAGSPTIGDDQTLRNTEDIGTVHWRQSTQPGTAGGNMLWSVTDSGAWMIGAVAFKPADSILALAGSAGTSGHGLHVPNFNIPL